MLQACQVPRHGKCQDGHISLLSMCIQMQKLMHQIPAAKMGRGTSSNMFQTRSTRKAKHSAGPSPQSTGLGCNCTILHRCCTSPADHAWNGPKRFAKPSRPNSNIVNFSHSAEAMSWHIGSYVAIQAATGRRKGRTYPLPAAH